MPGDFDFTPRAEYSENIFNASVVQVMAILDMHEWMVICIVTSNVDMMVAKMLVLSDAGGGWSP